MMDKVKNLLKKYKNKILTFVCVIACLPLFSISSYAYTTYDVFPVDVPLRFEFWSGDTLFSYYLEPNADNLYSLSNVQLNDVNSIYLNIRGSDFFSLPIDVSIFDYYFISSFYGEASDISNFTFYPNDIAVQYYDHNGLAYSYDKSDFLVYHTDTVLYKGFSTSCKIDFTNNSVVGDIVYGGNGSLPAKLKYEAMFLALPKGLSSGDINAAVVAAINNQTSVLGGKIDDTNNFIDKGNSSTGGIVSNFKDKDDELNEVVSQYREVENQFFEDFNTNQSAITSDIVGWSWGGLVNCADWVGTTLTDYYNNMGDFRQYIIYPLMLGIALFFLGRGGSIIGHLFRKPTQTTVNTKSVFRREGNTRYTTTTTSREGGVFRK